MRTPILTLALLLAAVTAHAQEAPYNRVELRDNVLSGVALNASAGTRTITANLYAGNAPRAEYSKARLIIAYTWAAASTVTIAFSCSADGTNYGPVMARNISSGTATISVLTDSYTTGGASATLGPEYDVRGCLKGKWVLGGAGAGASDLVTVDLSLVAGN